MYTISYNGLAQSLLNYNTLMCSAMTVVCVPACSCVVCLQMYVAWMLWQWCGTTISLREILSSLSSSPLSWSSMQSVLCSLNKKFVLSGIHWLFVQLLACMNRNILGTGTCKIILACGANYLEVLWLLYDVISPWQFPHNNFLVSIIQNRLICISHSFPQNWNDVWHSFISCTYTCTCMYSLSVISKVTQVCVFTLWCVCGHPQISLAWPPITQSWSGCLSMTCALWLC